MNVPTRKSISVSGDNQGGCMSRHMPPVGDESHRAENSPADDFGEHHHGSDQNDEPSSLLMAGVLCAYKRVMMLPWFDRVGVHENLPFRFQRLDQIGAPEHESMGLLTAGGISGLPPCRVGFCLACQFT
jgi:hypothetical protein